ncbi:MAG TPA: hypothetical protein VGL95_05010 [Acetobacteraceae bacterium]
MRARAGLAKAPTWIAHPPPGSAERLGSARADGAVGWWEAEDNGRVRAGGNTTLATVAA